MDNSFKHYRLHYKRMLNKRLYWDFAEKNPERFACKKPWMPKNKNG